MLIYSDSWVVYSIVWCDEFIWRLLIEEAALQNLLQILVEVLGIVGLELWDLFVYFLLLAFRYFSIADIVIRLVETRSPSVRSFPSSVRLRIIEWIEVCEVSLKSKVIRWIKALARFRRSRSSEGIVIVVVVAVIAVRFVWESIVSEQVSIRERDFLEEILNLWIDLSIYRHWSLGEFKRSKIEFLTYLQH